MSAQVYSGEETCGWGLQQMLEPIASCRMGNLQERKDLVKGRGISFIAACLLSIAGGSQGSRSCVLVKVMRNRTFQSQTNSKNRTLLGVIKELGLVFWHRCWDLGGPISTGARQL
jgi:hypothetical protein